MYKESSIDQVRDADIITIVSKYAEVKRAGSMYESLSPFNPNEKSPSFKISPAKNNFVCYSTQKKGDGIKFIMELENCNFYEAIQKIADICGIVLEREEETEEVKQKRTQKEELFRITEWAAKKYQKSLQHLPAEHWTKKMIADRQINEETLISFGIGYAPDEWKFLTNPIIESAKFELGISSGLVNSKDGNSFDFFKNRLIFPIEDVNGNIIGFGGRCSDEDNEKSGGRKYLNSKKTIIYDKSKSLFGIFQAKKSILKTKTPLQSTPIKPYDEVLCVPICDPHFGDKIINMDGDEVWNTDRAVAVFDGYANKSLEILSLHNRDKKSISKVVILSCGDNLTGETTYEGQLSQLDQFLDEQLETAATCFWKMILSFRELYKVPVEIAMVSGNHASGGGSPYNGG